MRYSGYIADRKVSFEKALTVKIVKLFAFSNPTNMGTLIMCDKRYGIFVNITFTIILILVD